MQWLKIKLLNWVLRGLFHALVEDDLVPLSRMSAKEVNNLASDARVILELPLWKRLSTEAKTVAKKRMFESSETVMDMLFGKALLYLFDLLDKRLVALSKIKKQSD